MKKYVTSMLLLALVWVGAGCSHTRSAHNSATAAETIVVERPEDNGSVNIVPCTVVFSIGQSIKLSGGETGTVSVAGSPLWVQASSVDPYHPETSDLRAWHSRRVEIRLNSGEVVRLSVEPKSRGSTYVSGWAIERAANKITGANAGGLRRFAIRPRWAAHIAQFYRWLHSSFGGMTR